MESLRESYAKQFLAITDSLSSDIHLIVDANISSILSSILGDMTLLKDRGIRQLSSFGTDFSTGERSFQDTLFLIRPTSTMTMEVSNYIRAANDTKGRFHLYFLPRWNRLCEEVLQLQGVRDSVSIGEFPVGFVPIADDILTLNMESCMRECYFDGNKSSLKDIAHSLVDLEQQFGEIPSIRLKGHLSKIVWKNMMQIKADVKGPMRPKSHGTFDTLILLDRKLDLASMLVTPLTYEGLIDEMFGIDNGYAQIVQDESEDSNTLATGDPKDQVYTELRSLHIEALGPHLKEEAKRVRNQYNEFRTKSENSTIGEVHEFVKSVPRLQQHYHSLAQHVDLAERMETLTMSKAFRTSWIQEHSILAGDDDLYDIIMEDILRQEPLNKVLQRFSLLCVAQNGIGEQEMNRFYKALVHTYGYELIFALEILEAVGLIYPRRSGCTFQKLRDGLSLIEDNPEVKNPTSISYVTSGYAPLSVRLVEEIVRHSSWASVSNLLRELPGPTAEISSNKLERGSKDKKSILVCIVGGASYLEVAALRQLSEIRKCRIVLCTTKVFSRDMFIESFINQAQSI